TRATVRRSETTLAPDRGSASPRLDRFSGSDLVRRGRSVAGIIAELVEAGARIRLRTARRRFVGGEAASGRRGRAADRRARGGAVRGRLTRSGAIVLASTLAVLATAAALVALLFVALGVEHTFGLGVLHHRLDQRDELLIGGHQVVVEGRL